MNGYTKNKSKKINFDTRLNKPQTSMKNFLMIKKNK